MRQLLKRLGYVERQEGRSLAVCHGDPAVTRQALALAALLQERYPRTPVVFLGDASDGGPAIGTEAVLRLPLPLRGAGSPRRLLKRTRTRIVLVAGAPGRAPGPLLRQAYDRGCSIVVLLDGTRPEGLERDLAALRAEVWLPLVDRVILLGGDGVAAPGIPQGKPWLLLPAALGTLTDEQRTKTLDVFDPLMTPSRREIASKRGLLSKKAVRLSRAKRWWPRALYDFKYRRLDTLEALRSALGAPKAILCLGNGPSSEDPRLLDTVYDCVFRVNFSWKTRRFMQSVEPDLIFTVLHEAVEATRPKVGFVFKTAEDETTMLGRFLLRPRRLTFAVAEELGAYDRSAFGHFSPTNGAVMLAVAAALRPERLIVAGVDLFSHPEGAYPGDSRTANNYTMGHDKDLESAFILSQLRRFPGKLEILSPALRSLVEQPSPGAFRQRSKV